MKRNRKRERPAETDPAEPRGYGTAPESIWSWLGVFPDTLYVAMIDAHIHVVAPNLPGVGSLHPILDATGERRAAALRLEMHTAGVSHALAMGQWNVGEEDPLGIQETLALAEMVPGLHAISVADPTRSDASVLRTVDAALARGQVCALKAYLGYLHYGPDHAGYRPYYELAERHGVPVVFHTGDTYSPLAKLRYALPLLVDDVAVDHPNVRFVLAHLGNPWLIDAAEVVYKNVNVWADVSGILVGGPERFTDEAELQTLHDTARAIAQAFRYAERPNRFLYGSDWPLVPMAAYRDFIRGAIPALHHELLFESTARHLFHLG